MKQQVLVDMDGVLADVYAQFINYEYNESGIRLSAKELNGKTEAEAFPHYLRHVNQENFFRNAPVITDSIEGLKYLNGKYKVLIVSSATEFPRSLTEKQAWLNQYFPFIGWEQMIFCGHKDAIKGDIMIDDHIKNLGNFEGKKLLFTQPHNVNIQDSHLHRVTGWKDVMRKL